MSKVPTMTVKKGDLVRIINSSDYPHWDADGWVPAGSFDDKSDYVESDTIPGLPSKGNQTPSKADIENKPIEVKTTRRGRPKNEDS